MPIDVSSRFKYVDSDLNEIYRVDGHIEIDGVKSLHYHPSTFLSLFPNESMKADRIRIFIENENNTFFEPID